jgi:hypothetical protein
VIKGKKGANGAAETDELIDMIFAKEETAKFVCRNIYRWFVTAHIDENTEAHIITPLAKILRANNFEVVPVLRTLLGSQHFFDPAFRGCIVKSPADFFLGAMQQFDVAFPSDASKNHLSWVQIHFFTEGLTMNVGTPPSVAGWPAYYQAPKYHQWWINSATLGFRSKLMDNFSSPKGEPCNGSDIKIDFVHFVSQLENPGNAEDLLNNCLELLFAVEISPTSISKLKSTLAGNQQTDIAWTAAWNKFSANQNDAKVKAETEERLRPFFKKLVRLPEFQMM